MAKDGQTAVVEEFGEGLLIILFEFEVLIEEFLLFLFVLELERGVFEDVHHNAFGLFFKEDITYTEKTCKFFKLPVDNPLNRRKVFLVSQVKHKDHLTKSRRLMILLKHKVRVTCSQKQGDQSSE